MASGKTEKGKIDYRIYNIDNIYTLYIKIDSQPNPENGVLEPIFSAIKSFPVLQDAKDYTTQL